VQALLPRLSLICIGLTPLFFLTVSHWTHIFFFVLTIIGIHQWLTGRSKLSEQDFLPILILASSVIAILTAQTLRGEITPRELDAPARFLLAIPIYLLIRNLLETQRLSASHVFNLLVATSATALGTLPYFVDDQRTASFGGRIATAQADVNTLGSYLGVLLVICLLGTYRQLSNTKPKAWVITLLSLSIMVGISSLIDTQSRGAWIACGLTTAMLALLLIRQNPAKVGKALFALAIIGSIAVAFSNHERALKRVTSIGTDVAAWANSEGRITSGSVRLDMLRISAELIKEKPLLGYGELGYAERLTDQKYQERYNPETLDVMSKTGPHQEVAARTLQSGLFGFLASVLILTGPVLCLLKSYRKTPSNPLLMVGLLFTSQTLLLQCTIEPFTLKYLASFNAVMLALFLAVSSAKLNRESL